jgi:hypothetical protein
LIVSVCTPGVVPPFGTLRIVAAGTSEKSSSGLFTVKTAAEAMYLLPSAG